MPLGQPRWILWTMNKHSREDQRTLGPTRFNSAGSLFSGGGCPSAKCRCSLCGLSYVHVGRTACGCLMCPSHQAPPELLGLVRRLPRSKIRHQPSSKDLRKSLERQSCERSSTLPNAPSAIWATPHISPTQLAVCVGRVRLFSYHVKDRSCHTNPEEE